MFKFDFNLGLLLETCCFKGRGGGALITSTVIIGFILVIDVLMLLLFGSAPSVVILD